MLQCQDDGLYYNNNRVLIVYIIFTGIYQHIYFAIMCKHIIYKYNNIMSCMMSDTNDTGRK